jgi:hypothetical protein
LLCAYALAAAAGLVKVLRRCVRDMAGKCSSVVELCVKAEKEMSQEVSSRNTRTARQVFWFWCALSLWLTQEARLRCNK